MTSWLRFARLLIGIRRPPERGDPALSLILLWLDLHVPLAGVAGVAAISFNGHVLVLFLANQSITVYSYSTVPYSQFKR